jgi:molybdopterin molybdotransferase
MISIAAAENIILGQVKNYGTEHVPLHMAQGRVLAEDLRADRDMPPYNRVAMDGIAIRFDAIKSGINTFHIKGVQAAGDEPINITDVHECVEIMTGCALPDTTDTVIRYEDLLVNNGTAVVQTTKIMQQQHVHFKGQDKKRGEIVAAAGQVIMAPLVNVAATIGADLVCVKKLPRVVVISTGNELVAIQQTPTTFQIRQSNNYMLQAALQAYGIQPQLLHIPDYISVAMQQLQECIMNYDVIILSGGVSAGRFDYLPQVLEQLGVKKHFHKIEQKPGKPFWFGEASNGVLVFAFPGNPVSSFLCLQRYLIPWLKESLQLPMKRIYALLAEDFNSTHTLPYFLQVKLAINEQAQLMATPVSGSGSGDQAHLAEADGFMELPAGKALFPKGASFRVWPFAALI